jgi:hypothetical protein
MSIGQSHNFAGIDPFVCHRRLRRCSFLARVRIPTLISASDHSSFIESQIFGSGTFPLRFKNRISPSNPTVIHGMARFLSFARNPPNSSLCDSLSRRPLFPLLTFPFFSEIHFCGPPNDSICSFSFPFAVQSTMF